VVVFKKLVGGGHLTLVDQAVETALARLSKLVLARMGRT
jgi:hypothetical protein